MSSGHETSVDPRVADARSLGGSGAGAIIAALILGGAVIIGTIMLWEAHQRKLAISETAMTEMKVRGELRASYEMLRARRPAEALAHAAEAGALMDSRLKSRWQTDYAELKTARNFIEAEALLMADSRGNAGAAEHLFDQALGLMTRASGEFWRFGVLGRGRTRLELGRYEDALADFDMLLDRNPNFGAAYYWRSLTRKSLGDARGAADDERRARSLDSWPPLRDFLQTGGEEHRDFLNRREK